MKLVFTCLFLVVSLNAFGWGRIGHMTIAEIAEKNLEKKTEKEVMKLTEKMPLAFVANWADDVRNDLRFKSSFPWHYVNLNGKSYFENEKLPEGDVLRAIFRMIDVLKNKKSKLAKKKEALNYLVHYMGDFHQPFHLGDKENKGGSQFEVKWFYYDSNLHYVWDHEMIDLQKLSYTEMVNLIHRSSDKENKEIMSGGFLNWMDETQQKLLANNKEAYNWPTTKYPAFAYTYKHLPTVKEQLLKAGLRLASVLNEIYVPKSVDRKSQKERSRERKKLEDFWKGLPELKLP